MYQPTTHAALKERNRNLLLAALDAGITSRRVDIHRWAVSADSQEAPYQVSRWADGAGAVHWICTCPWGKWQGRVVLGDEVHENAGCKHILFVRFAIMPRADREAMLDYDPGLRAAELRYQPGALAWAA